MTHVPSVREHISLAHVHRKPVLEHGAQTSGRQYTVLVQVGVYTYQHWAKHKILTHAGMTGGVTIAVAQFTNTSGVVRYFRVKRH
jgi:hypothetical protein